MSIDNMEKNKYQLATFGAGCFWQVEEDFREIPGVKSTAVGFMGGDKSVTYEEVSMGNTGHAEVLHIEYDPKEVKYDKLLEIFWAKHDPTTLNRQGPDIGHQYRSVIFYHNDKQKKIAEQSKEKMNKSGKFEKEIVTEIVLAGEFHKAEEYHQGYLKKRGLKSCHI